MKKYLSLILALGICMSMCVFPAAAISANEAENEVLTEDEFTELLTAEMSSNEFGGLYYEGDTLVVNVIASQKATSLRPQLAQKAPEDIDVEYRTVTYSLSELERIKNFLTGYMSDYSIMIPPILHSGPPQWMQTYPVQCTLQSGAGTRRPPVLSAPEASR